MVLKMGFCFCITFWGGGTSYSNFEYFIFLAKNVLFYQHFSCSSGAEGSAGKSPNFLCLGETDKRVMLADRRRASGDSGDTASASSVHLVRPVSCQV